MMVNVTCELNVRLNNVGGFKSDPMLNPDMCRIFIVEALFPCSQVIRFVLAMASVSYAIMCVYPISGTYTFFQRVLYYMVLLFGFSVRGYDWLVSVALGYALTTSGAAAIHALVLAMKSNFMFDIDHHAIRTMLSPSILTVFPLMQYSYNFWNADVKAILITWWWLVAVANGFASYYFPRREYNDGYQAIMTCASQQSWAKFNRTLQLEFSYKYNNSLCYDPCANVSQSDIFHTSADTLVPFVFGIYNPDATGVFEKMPPSYKAAATASIVLMVLVVLQRYILGDNHPDAIRNWVFRHINRKGVVSERRMRTAKIVAIFAFFTPHMATLALVSLLAIDLVYGEIALRQMPESESPWAVGQWTPWASLGMTLAVTIFIRLRTLWNTIKANSDQVSLEPPANSIGSSESPPYTTSSPGPDAPLHRASTLLSANAPQANAFITVLNHLLVWVFLRWSSASTRVYGFPKVKKLLGVSEHVYRHLISPFKSSRKYIMKAAGDLVSFWRDPVAISGSGEEDGGGVELQSTAGEGLRSRFKTFKKISLTLSLGPAGESQGASTAVEIAIQASSREVNRPNTWPVNRHL